MALETVLDVLKKHYDSGRLRNDKAENNPFEFIEAIHKFQIKHQNSVQIIDQLVKASEFIENLSSLELSISELKPYIENPLTPKVIKLLSEHPYFSKGSNPDARMLAEHTALVLSKGTNITILELKKLASTMDTYGHMDSGPLEHYLPSRPYTNGNAIIINNVLAGLCEYNGTVDDAISLIESIGQLRHFTNRTNLWSIGDIFKSMAITKYKTEDAALLIKTFASALSTRYNKGKGNANYVHYGSYGVTNILNATRRALEYMRDNNLNAQDMVDRINSANEQIMSEIPIYRRQARLDELKKSTQNIGTVARRIGNRIAYSFSFSPEYTAIEIIDKIAKSDLSISQSQQR